ncbi:hypothetical protein C3747_93g115 [Trypanosoma cruzi]|uniref:RRM domain-containing protein n=2 Tax=Trypanosoma cruzi TaxID=5693 RepID=Q4DK58_TRYCC|nr:hypothetical protein, conserved [Trypanosoma cruzi]EAN92916.1 hypothetical protein, conserved [Trypanosoma cruzi]PWV08173.1 hypothetical protein C3747_93g115 [Trypanosoma cruzi]RNC58483.1 hypothetical protein TcCL_ESM03947 [Trypanosoma cruzi]|eukprot:XP_814767.1 hypothetical protein [Trypanosoma cruzi strain CL Brener]
MPAKKKGGRGKTINLVDFNDEYIPEDNLDWAVEVPREKSRDELAGEKIAKRDYSRTANNALMEKGGFRDSPSEPVNRTKGINDLQPPFVAHFGNLRNGTTEEEFLRNFHEDCIVTSRLISQDGKSFAFVEFKTAQALAIALAMDQTMVKGRKLYVDLATQKQVERLHGHNGISRQNAGQSQQGAGLQQLNLTRDAFGSTQMTERETGHRSGFCSRNDLHMLADLSRDTLGTATRSSESAASPVGQPDFSSWRNEGPVAQPEFHPGLPENRRSDAELDRRGGMGGGRNSKRQSPVSAGCLANWRDEPMTQPPPPPPLPPPGSGSGGDNSKNNGEDGRKGGWASDGAGRGNHRGPPKSQAAPRDDSKWEALRR